MRHADTAWEGAAGDRMRALTSRGRMQAARAGVALAATGWAPTVVVCSGALRAAQTWNLLSPALPVPGVFETTLDLYHGGPAAYLSAVDTWGGKADTVMLVGHNPSVGELVELLSEERVRFGTAHVVLLRAVPNGPWPGWGVAMGTPLRFEIERVLEP